MSMRVALIQVKTASVYICCTLMLEHKSISNLKVQSTINLLLTIVLLLMQNNILPLEVRLGLKLNISTFDKIGIDGIEWHKYMSLLC